MKITSIIDIVKGKLQNIPSISFITQTHTKVKKINYGDLFISSNLLDIKNAIQLGAFAIIYDGEIDEIEFDYEIAWIKVENIEDACLKLMRYHLSTFYIDVLFVDEISYDIFNIYKRKLSNQVYLDNDIKNNLELIQNNNHIQCIISNDIKTLKAIYPNCRKFIIHSYDLKNLTIHSLFECTFTYKDTYYYKAKIPVIYIDNFISVMHYLKIKKPDLNKLNNFKYMKSIFINKSLYVLDHGKSSTFIIANNIKKTNFLEIAFLNRFYSHAKILVCHDEDDMSLVNIIKNATYNALYITSRSNLEIIELLKKHRTKSIELF